MGTPVDFDLAVLILKVLEGWELGNDVAATIRMMKLMMLMMTKPSGYDDSDDDNGHKHDSYTAAGAAPGARVPCPLCK